MTVQTWDFATWGEYVRIEVVEGDEVVGLICELPVNLEEEAEVICNAHNASLEHSK